MLYLWLKGAHVASVLIFVGGLFVQSLATASLWSGTNHLHKAIEIWDRRVTTPALLATWLFGVLLAIKGEFFPSGWLIIKLMLVVMLSGLHGVQSGRLRRFLMDRSAKAKITDCYTPIAVGVCVVAIAILAVVKPF